MAVALTGCARLQKTVIISDDKYYKDDKNEYEHKSNEAKVFANVYNQPQTDDSGSTAKTTSTPKNADKPGESKAAPQTNEHTDAQDSPGVTAPPAVILPPPADEPADSGMTVVELAAVSQEEDGRLFLPVERGIMASGGSYYRPAAYPAPVVISGDACMIWKVEAALSGRLILNMEYAAPGSGAVRATVKHSEETLAELDRPYTASPDGYSVTTLGVFNAEAGQELTIELSSDDGEEISVRALVSQGCVGQGTDETLELTSSNIKYVSDMISSEMIDIADDWGFAVWKVELGAFDAVGLLPDFAGQEDCSFLYTLFSGSGDELAQTEVSYDGSPPRAPAYLISGNTPADVYFVKLQKLGGGLCAARSIALTTHNARILEADIHIVDNELNPAVTELSVRREETFSLSIETVPPLERLLNETVEWTADPELFETDRTSESEILLRAKAAGMGKVTATVYHEDEVVRSEITVTVAERQQDVRFVISPSQARNELENNPGCLSVVRVLGGSQPSGRYQLMQRSESSAWRLPPGNYAYYLKGNEIGYHNKSGRFSAEDSGGEMEITVDFGEPAGDTDAVAQNYKTGALSLLPKDAHIYTPKAKSNLTADSKGRFSGWIDTREYPYWRVAFTKPGTYNIKIKLGAQGTGGTLDLMIDGVKMIENFPVPVTKGGWNSYEELDFGTLTITEAGIKTVKLVRTYAKNPYSDFSTAPNVHEIMFSQ